MVESFFFFRKNALRELSFVHIDEHGWIVSQNMLKEQKQIKFKKITPTEYLL